MKIAIQSSLLTFLTTVGIFVAISGILFVFNSFPLQSEFKTKSGIQCVKSVFFISCNWERWNLETNYGIYPDKPKE